MARSYGGRRAFLPFVADLVGNTICADLVDYLQCDHLFTGLPAKLGHRLIQGIYVTRDDHGAFPSRTLRDFVSQAATSARCRLPALLRQPAPATVRRLDKRATRVRLRRPSRCWPCKSNSVCLSSSSRALTRVGALGASAGVLAAGPVEQAYSSEPPRARSLVARPNPRGRACQRSPSPSSRGLLAGLPLRVARAPHCFVGGHGAPAQVAPASELGHAAAQPPSECSPDRHRSTRHHLLSAERTRITVLAGGA